MTKRFGHLVANREVDFDVVPGEVHGLLGENGSGKTTLVNLLYGLLRPDAGEILVSGRPVVMSGPRGALSRGIALVPQQFRLAPALTVSENVALGLYPRWRPHRRVLRDVSRHLAALGARYGLEIDPEARVESLGVGERQRTAILRALYHGPRVLLMDEPTSVLTDQESERLVDMVARMARDERRAVVLVTHRIREVLGVVHRVTVLRHGCRVATLSARELSVVHLMEAMMGERVTDRAPSNASTRSPAARSERRPVLRVQGLCVWPGAADDSATREPRRVSFTVHEGEIFGIGGIEGNGQRELEHALAGLSEPAQGKVCVLANRDLVGYIPSDVDQWGVIRDLTVGENLLLREAARAPALGPWPTPGAGALRSTEELLRRFSVEPADPALLLRQLSGGNVQKVLLARELAAQPALLVAAQPTRGLDVAAAAFVNTRLRSAALSGTAVVMISSDLDELVGLCDRIGILYRGELIGVWDAGEAPIGELAAAMTGVRRVPGPA